MSSTPQILYGQDTASNYQGQNEMLSKHFARDHSGGDQQSLFVGLKD
jgi:hypothetical protein